jgi:Concanavalin A-like lectin/glucanases superfamily/Carbohydrate binding domain
MKLGLGLQKAQALPNRPPMWPLLDQYIKGKVPENGQLKDWKGNLMAQIVEQPAGVFADAFVDFGKVISLGTNSFTISVGITSNSDSVYGAFLLQRSVNYNLNSLGYGLYYKHSTNSVIFNIGDGANGARISYNLPLFFGTYIATGTYDSTTGTMKLYIDNILVATDVNADLVGNSITDPDNNLKIGGDTTYFNGKIWNCGIWSGVLDISTLNPSTALFYCPDPSTGYDCSGNANHGTVTDVEPGTQDVSALFHVYGFNKYIRCLTNGTIRLKWEGAYSYRFWNGSAWSTVTGTVTSGNYLTVVMTAGQMFGLLTIASKFISLLADEYHQQSGTYTDWIVIGDPSNPGFDCEGNTLHFTGPGIKLLGAIEFKPVGGKSVITNETFEDGVTGWSTTNNDISSVSGGIHGNCLKLARDGSHDYPQTLTIFTVVSEGIYQYSFWHKDIDGTGIVPRLSFYDQTHDAYISGFDDKVLTNETEWSQVSGLITMPTDCVSCRIQLKSPTSTGTEAYYFDDVIVVENETPELEIYNRLNEDGFKDQIRLMDSFDPEHPYRHQLTEFGNDYLRCLATRSTLKQLFLKQDRTDEDWVVITTFLNYGTELTDTEITRVLNYLKDPTKSHLEIWEAFQASTVVAAWRFGEEGKFSLFNNNGELCALGWEGEELLNSSIWSCDPAYGTLTGTDPFRVTSTAIDGGYYSQRALNAVLEIAKFRLRYTVRCSTPFIMRIRQGNGGSRPTLSTINVTTSDVNYDLTFDVTDLAQGAQLNFEPATVLAIGDWYEVTGCSIVKVGNLVAAVLDCGSGMNGLGDILDGWDFTNWTEYLLATSKTAISFTTSGIGGIFKDTLNVGTKYRWRIIGTTFAIGGFSLPNTDEIPVIANGDFDTVITFTQNTNGLLYMKHLGAGTTIFTKSELVEVTYYPLTQTDITKQGKRGPEGIEFDGVNTEYPIPSPLISPDADFAYAIKFKANDLSNPCHLLAIDDTNMHIVELKSGLLKVGFYHDGSWHPKSIAFTDTSEFHILDVRWNYSDEVAYLYLDDVRIDGAVPLSYGVSGSVRSLGSGGSAAPATFNGIIEYFKIS